MPFDPEKYHRQSIRLRGFDYSRAGLYFVTLCVQGRESLLGAVEDGLLRMNDAGWMVERWWLNLPDKFPSVMIDAYVVMPNHFHGIVVIVDSDVSDANIVDIGAGGHAGPPLHDVSGDFTAIHGVIGAGGHAGPPLHDVSDVKHHETDDPNVHNIVGPNDTADRDAVGADQRVCPPRNPHESADSNVALPSAQSFNGSKP